MSNSRDTDGSAPAGHGLRRVLRGLAALLLLGACAPIAPTLNAPLRSPAGNTEYRLLDLARGAGSNGSLVMVALSGGGMRSAAFGFGVLQGMSRTRLRRGDRDATLLDADDLLAGVSGGAFPAAYFGLYGTKGFATFRDDFLYRNIESYVWGTFLLPWHWGWVFNPLIGTNDRMAQVYDRLMFRGATYTDLFRRGRPQISINATDISFGIPFGFLPQSFDAICSDLSQEPIATAVAASNGFPVLFGPVNLRNWRGPECPLPPPPQQFVQNDLRAQTALAARERYADGSQVRWIHLMDGGISDNLGLRVLINDALLLDDSTDRLASALLPVRRILVISVDAGSAPNPNWPRQQVVSGLSQIVSAATGAQIRAYNLETLIAMQSTIENLVDHIRRSRCARGSVVDGYRCDDVAGKVLRISLGDYPDRMTRAKLVAIRTGLNLSRQQVDMLIAAGETMIRRDGATIIGFLDASPTIGGQARR